jgi:tetratricopeptide (TPR) repeat protein
VGLANAYFWLYETSRYRLDADVSALSLAIEQARCAVELDRHFAEAQATLAYVLAGAGRTDEALRAGRTAVALEPDRWAHHFRLGNAAWGEERLRTLGACLELYPEFPFAHLQIAMVHVARHGFEPAVQALRQGAALQARYAARRARFPANGLHWMLGAIELTRGDRATAVAEFTRELESGRDQLYGPEYAIAALTAHGFALLEEDAVDPAIEMFRRALALHSDQPRALLGLSLSNRRRQNGAGAEALERAEGLIAALARADRSTDAALMAAGAQIVRGRPEQALQTLAQLLARAPAGSAGWAIPIEPLFRPLRVLPGYDNLLAALAARAR